MNPFLIGPIKKLADKVLDKVLPDKKAAAQAKLEFEKQAAALDIEEVKNFQDFMLGYEGRGDQVHPFIQVLRGSVRPVLTYALAGAYIWGFLNPGQFNGDVTQGLWQLNLISLGFWYGERALKNLGLNLGKRN